MSEIEKMTFKDAMLRKDITHIRQPHWNESACLEMPPWVGEHRGVWVHLIDLGSRTPICVFELYKDEYDQYESCEAKPYDKETPCDQ